MKLWELNLEICSSWNPRQSFAFTLRWSLFGLKASFDFLLEQFIFGERYWILANYSCLNSKIKASVHHVWVFTLLHWRWMGCNLHMNDAKNKNFKITRFCQLFDAKVEYQIYIFKLYWQACFSMVGRWLLVVARNTLLQINFGEQNLLGLCNQLLARSYRITMVKFLATYYLFKLEVFEDLWCSNLTDAFIGSQVFKDSCLEFN